MIFITFWCILFITSTLGWECDFVNFVSRAQWGARNTTKPLPTLPTPVNHVFILDSDTGNACTNPTTCVGEVKGIQNYDIDKRKWKDTGSNFIVGGDGRIYEGRGWNAVGDHTFGINNQSIGLLFVGKFETENPPKIMLDSAQNFIRCGVEMKVISAKYELHGHRDQRCSHIPGQRLYDTIKAWNNFKGKLSSYIC